MPYILCNQNIYQLPKPALTCSFIIKVKYGQNTHCIANNDRYTDINIHSLIYFIINMLVGIYENLGLN